MISPVVVVVNTMKPFTHASPRYGELRRGSCKRLFCCPNYIRTPYVNKHLHGWRGREHRAALHPADNPRRLCAWYCKRQGDMVRQDPYRMKRTLKGKLAGIARGLKGEASHPWGTYA